MNTGIAAVAIAITLAVAGAGVYAAVSGDDRETVTVTMPWQKEMLDEITQGKTYNVHLLARDGTSVHDSIPLSVGDIVKLKESKLWFTVGKDLRIEGELSVYKQVEESMAGRIIDTSIGVKYLAGDHHHHGNDGIVEVRQLTEWKGLWQSMHSYVQDGSMSDFIKFKARETGKTEDEIKTQYLELYNSDYSAVKFDGSTVTFTSSAGSVSSSYAYEEYKTANKDGSIMAWYVYKNSDPLSQAPKFISVNDHSIKVGGDDEDHPHFHMRYGDTAESVTAPPSPWAPTFFEKGTSADDMCDVMIDHSGGYNMHIWCSPVNLAIIAGNVKNALIGADPDNAGIYTEGYNGYMAKVNALKAKADAVLTPLEDREIMVWHGAWGYLFEPYDIDEESLQDVVGHGVKDLTVANIMDLKEEISDERQKVLFASPHDLIMNKSYKSQLGIPVVEANPNSLRHIDALSAFLDAIELHKEDFPSD